MARHAQPRELAELKGATRKHPERYRKEPPTVEYPLGDPPAHMSVAAKGVWVEISTYAPKDVLRGSDRLVLEMLCYLIVQCRQSPEDFPASKYTAIAGYAGRLGLSPADRQKLGVEKGANDGNPFDAF